MLNSYCLISSEPPPNTLMLHNPSVREEPLDQPAPVIPIKNETSILDWLENTGRLLARDESKEVGGYLEEEEDIDNFMGGDDIDYDFDDDEDDLVLDDEE